MGLRLCPIASPLERVRDVAVVLVPLVFALTFAGAPPAGSLYRVDPALDVGLTAGTLGIIGLVEKAPSALDGVPPCPSSPEGLCDPSTVNALDRWVTEEGSSTARTASDVLVTAIVLAPLAVHGAEAMRDGVAQPGLRFGEGAVVTLEGYGASMLAVQLLKYSVQRPRPLTYNAAFSEEVRFAKDAHLSFPSGHSTLAFSAATSLSLALLEHHDGSALAWAGAGASYATAAFVGWLRMAAGKHFVTDVLAGAVLGTAITYGVVAAHRRSADEPFTAASAPALFAVGGAW